MKLTDDELEMVTGGTSNTMMNLCSGCAHFSAQNGGYKCDWTELFINPYDTACGKFLEKE